MVVITEQIKERVFKMLFMLIIFVVATITVIVAKNIIELVVGGTLILLNKFNENVQLSEENLDNWTNLTMVIVAIVSLIIAVI